MIQETIDKKFQRYMELAKSQCHDEIEEIEIKDILKTLKNNKALESGIYKNKGIKEDLNNQRGIFFTCTEGV